MVAADRGLRPRPVVVVRGHDRDLALGGGDVLVSQPQRLANATAAVLQQGKKETVPQVLACLEDGLHLRRGQHPRQLLRRLQRDRPPGCGLPGLMWCRNGFQPPRRPGACQVISSSPTSTPCRAWMGVERGQRRQLPVHRRRADVRAHRRQHRHLPPRPAGGRPARPRTRPDPPAAPPASPTRRTPGTPVVLQVMGVGLDRVRGSLDVGQVGQVSLDRPDRDVVIAQNRPRLRPRQASPPAARASLLHFIDMLEEAGDNHVHATERSAPETRAGQDRHPAKRLR